MHARYKSSDSAKDFGQIRQKGRFWDAAFVLTVGSFLLTVELLCLQLCLATDFGLPQMGV